MLLLRRLRLHNQNGDELGSRFLHSRSRIFDFCGDRLRSLRLQNRENPGRLSRPMWPLLSLPGLRTDLKALPMQERLI
jgi:hypothetical protein